MAKEGIATINPNTIDREIDTIDIKIVVVNPLNKNFRFDKKTIIILGNEGKGIRKNILNNSDFIISLPQEEVSGIDSYNAANSLAMTLFHYKVNLL